MPNCIYRGCQSHSKNKENGLSFHRFPNDEALKAEWLMKMGIEKITKDGSVCSKHFMPGDVLYIRNQFHLRKGATPCKDVFNVPTSRKRQRTHEPLHESNHRIFFNNEILNDEETVPHFKEIVEAEVIVTGHNVNTSTESFAKKIRFVSHDHSYRKKRRIVIKRTAEHEAAIQLIVKQRKEIDELKRNIRNLRRKQRISAKANKAKYAKFDNLTKLSAFVQEFIWILLTYFNKTSTPRKYSPEMRQFCLTLHYYSPSAYRFIREVFNHCVPCEQTIRNWYRSIDGSPGFTNESLITIQNLQFNTPYPIVGCFSVDGMKLRKHLQNNGRSTFGYVDYGGVISGEKFELATEALNFMFVGVNVPFKIQVGYFLINGIDHQKLAYLTTTGVRLLRDCSVIVGTLAYDGLSGNMAMSRAVGCEYDDVHNLKTTIDIDVDDCPYKMFAWPDMCHMVKLFRNAFHEMEVFLDDFDQRVEWKYFKALFQLQQNIGLRLGNKMRSLHIHYKNQIMKVYLATQLFSNSVADAIEVCDKSFKLPDFKHSGPTVECIRMINDLFDIFNSVSSDQQSYKKPLSRENYNYIMNRLDEINTYLLGLKEINGRPMYKSDRKTGFIGMLMLIQSLKGFYKEYVLDHKLLSFVPTYKASQDNLEIFHGNMRSHSGYNTNPTPTQYRNSYKKSLVHVQFICKKTGNCIPQEDIPILHANSTLSAPLPIHNLISDLDDFELELEGMVYNIIENQLLSSTITCNHLDEYVNIIAYISGFVSRRLTTVLKCKTCASALITDDENDTEFCLINTKNMGGLFLPSRSVREICSFSDKTFMHALKVSGGKMLKPEFTIDKMNLCVCKNFMEDKTLFEKLEVHFQEFPSECHYYILMKSIAVLYLKVRVHYLNKVISSNNGRRQKNTHATHFLGM